MAGPGARDQENRWKQYLEDERIALFLQNEEFMKELQRNRDFLLALERGGAPGGGAVATPLWLGKGALGLRGGTELEATGASVLLIHGPHQIILWESQNSANRDTSHQPTLLPPLGLRGRHVGLRRPSLLCPCPCTSPVCQALTLA